MQDQNRERRDLFDRLFSLPFFRLFAPLYHRFREVWLYLCFGVLTTAVSWGSFYLLCYPLGWNELVANILSWIAAVLFAFLTNRTWVFSELRAEDGFFREMLLFFGARLSTLAAEELILYIFVTRLSLSAMIVKMLGNIVVLVLNYFLSKCVVFRKK